MCPVFEASDDDSYGLKIYMKCQPLSESNDSELRRADSPGVYGA